MRLGPGSPSSAGRPSQPASFSPSDSNVTAVPTLARLPIAPCRAEGFCWVSFCRPRSDLARARHATPARVIPAVPGLGQQVGAEGGELLRRHEFVDPASVGGAVEVVH